MAGGIGCLLSSTGCVPPSSTAVPVIACGSVTSTCTATPLAPFKCIASFYAALALAIEICNQLPRVYLFNMYHDCVSGFWVFLGEVPKCSLGRSTCNYCLNALLFSPVQAPLQGLYIHVCVGGMHSFSEGLCGRTNADMSGRLLIDVSLLQGARGNWQQRTARQAGGRSVTVAVQASGTPSTSSFMTPADPG